MGTGKSGIKGSNYDNVEFLREEEMNFVGWLIGIESVIIIPCHGGEDTMDGLCYLELTV